MAKKKSGAAVQQGLDIAVTWGNVTVGDKTVNMRATANRGNLTVGTADKTLCGKRLKVSVLARSNGGPDQESLPNMDADIVVDGIADVKNYTVGPKYIAFGLTFVIASIDLQSLTQFAKRDGCCTVMGVEELPEEGGEE